MKKNKMEVLALTLMLFVLCYAFYDCNVKGKEQNIVLANELFSMREIKDSGITMETLSLPEDLVSNEQEEVEEPTIEVYSISFEAENNTIPYNEVVSNQVVNYALQFVGGPYVYGGNSLTNGTDCSGFTMLVMQNYGISLPRNAFMQSYSGVSVGVDNIMPGDLVFFGYDGVVSHVGIYIGDNKVVHAMNSDAGIVVTDLYIMPVLDVRRVI